jgi:hypothetical protein
LNNSATGNELASRNSSTDIQNWSPASDFLNTRSYIGLSPSTGDTDVTEAVIGKSGIAKGYEGEGDK